MTPSKKEVQKEVAEGVLDNVHLLQKLEREHQDGIAPCCSSWR